MRHCCCGLILIVLKACVASLEIVEFPNQHTNVRNATFIWTCDGSCSLDYLLDNEMWVPVPEGANRLHVRVANDGNHTILLRDTRGGNTTLPPSIESWWWWVDTTAPSTHLLTAPSEVWRHANIMFTFDSDDSSVTRYRYRFDEEEVRTAEFRSADGGSASGSTRFSWRDESASLFLPAGGAVSVDISLRGIIDASARPAWLALEVQDGCILQNQSRAQSFNSSGTLSAYRFWPLDMDAETVIGDNSGGVSETMAASRIADLNLSPLELCKPLAGATVRLLDENGTTLFSATLSFEETETWWLSHVFTDEGVHRVEVMAVDDAGNCDPTPATSTFTLDYSPWTIIDSAPRLITYAGSALFLVSCKLKSGEGSEIHWDVGACNFDYSIDGAPMRALASAPSEEAQLDFTALMNGPHNVTLRACDLGSTVGADTTAGVNRTAVCDAHPPTFWWVVDTTPPTTSFLSLPGTSIDHRDDARAAVVIAPQSSFAFASNKERVSFSCRLDGDEQWQTCPKRSSFELADGSHTIEVRSIDETGNPDGTPIRHEWSVNTLETALVECPRFPVSVGSVTVRARPTSTHAIGTPCSDCTVQFALDGTLVSDVATTPSTAAGHTFDDLTDGLHAITARAVRSSDGLTDPTPATCLVSVNRSIALNLPVVTFIEAPPEVSTAANTTVVLAVWRDDTVSNLTAIATQPSPSPTGATAVGNISNATLPVHDSDPNVTESVVKRSNTTNGTTSELPPPSSELTLTPSPAPSLDSVPFISPAASLYSYSFDVATPSFNETIWEIVEYTSNANAQTAVPTSNPTAPPSSTPSPTSLFLKMEYWLHSAITSDHANATNSIPQSWIKAPASGRVELGSLRDGAYALAARVASPANDHGKSSDVVSMLYWTIDTEPEVTLLEVPDVVSHSSKNVSIAFCSSKSFVSFNLLLDEADLQKTTRSKVMLPRLQPGNHSVSIAAVDAAGLEGPRTSYSWDVDLGRPETRFVEAPSRLSTFSEARLTVIIERRVCVSRRAHHRQMGHSY